MTVASQAAPKPTIRTPISFACPVISGSSSIQRRKTKDAATDTASCMELHSSTLRGKERVNNAL